ADPADYQLDADALPPQHQQQLPQYTAGSQYTPVSDRHRLRHRGGQSASSAFESGQHPGPRRSAAADCGSGLLTAAALHHFCKEPARRQLLDRLVRIGSSIKLCCRGLRGSCCPAGIAHLVASNGAARGGKSATGAAAAAALRLRTRAESTELLMECRNRPTPFGGVAAAAGSVATRRIRSLTLRWPWPLEAADLVCGLKAADGWGRTQRSSMPWACEGLELQHNSDSSRSTVKTRAILPMARILLRITSLRAAMAFAGD
uniref:Kinesin motor domain-containing protein n=1 Tax=Macrostomum lignano TaxID=282301 RepID=A0A1I8FC51_9PLAT